MRVSVMVHPPSKGDSLEYRLRVEYRNGSSGLVQLPQGSTWSTVETYVETALDLDDVVGVVVFGRPAVEYRSTRGHDVDGWRVDARYSLDGWADLEHGDDLEGGAR